MTVATSTKIQQADTFCDQAREALLKPEEDIVPYQICEHSYKAVKSYLQGFLLEKFPENKPSEVLEELVVQVQSIDPEFEALKLSQMFRPTNYEDIWMSLNTARLFLSLAETTRQKVSQS